MIKEVATISFRDAGSSDEAVAIVRRDGERVALCLSLLSGGDVEVVMERETADKLVAALRPPLKLLHPPYIRGIHSNQERRQELVAKYLALDARTREWFLASLGYWLSTDARGTYVAAEEGVSDGAQLRRFNEAQHRIFDQLEKMLDGIDQRYPDDVFANILVDHFDMLKLDPRWMVQILAERRRQPPSES